MKKRMRWIAVVLSVVCVIETMGCGTTPKENNTTQETIDTTEGEVSEGAKRFEGTTIYMIAEQQTPTEALKKQLDLFTEETGIVVCSSQVLLAIPSGANCVKSQKYSSAATDSSELIAIFPSSSKTPPPKDHA